MIAAAPLIRTESCADLALLVAGHAPRKADWIHHRFNVHAVGLVVAGRGTYRVDDGPVVEIGPGSLFAVWPGPVFHYGPERGTTWDEYHVGCGGAGLGRWIASGWLFTDGSVRTLGRVEHLTEMFRELLALRRRQSRGDSDRTVLLAERLMMEMYHAQRQFQPDIQSARSIDVVLRELRQNFDQRVDWKQLSRRHAMSYSLLRQRIREVTGLPPAAYLTHLRCDRARSLLAETDQPIKVIAEAVGIADPFTFSRTFRRTTGVSPRQYRRQASPWAHDMVPVALHVGA